MKIEIGTRISSLGGYAQAVVTNLCTNGDIVAETAAGAVVTLSPGQYHVLEAKPFKQKITAADFMFLRSMRVGV
jgi:hypothetical protein